ncbi:WSSV093 [White spot syndrome virus]|uniref:WSSV093 n=1 Tax=White spot syndrome virus TaxID=92652 RepID=Q8QTF7_WSSV|nr:WSSV093 [Shrimp white spot syndrome virus]
MAGTVPTNGVLSSPMIACLLESWGLLTPGTHFIVLTSNVTNEGSMLGIITQGFSIHSYIPLNFISFVTS